MTKRNEKSQMSSRVGSSETSPWSSREQSPSVRGERPYGPRKLEHTFHRLVPYALFGAGVAANEFILHNPKFKPVIDGAKGFLSSAYNYTTNKFHKIQNIIDSSYVETPNTDNEANRTLSVHEGNHTRHHG